jgi:methionine-rich copper-binding protein CopC
MNKQLSIVSAARVAAAALALAATSLAFAHAMPTHQEPAAGATVTATQSKVAIDFDDRLEPAFSSINVTDAQGKPVVSGKSAVDTANPKHMSVSIGTLAPGKYTVAWVAVAADGHRTQGRYTFSVK